MIDALCLFVPLGIAFGRGEWLIQKYPDRIARLADIVFGKEWDSEWSE